MWAIAAEQTGENQEDSRFIWYFCAGTKASMPDFTPERDLSRTSLLGNTLQDFGSKNLQGISSQKNRRDVCYKQSMYTDLKAVVENDSETSFKELLEK